MDLGLAGANVFVQGGTRGMGRAAAECFAEDGARVAVFGRTKADLDETVKRLQELGSPEAIGIQGDICEADQVTAAFEQIGERWTELNVLVNMAGPDVGGGFEELSDEQSS